MTASNPISAQDKGELPPIVPAAIQMPKAIIPIEIGNENAAFMLASIPKKIVQPKSRIASRKIEADGIVGARQILLSLSPSPLAHLQLF
jgi:hypothetical protein